MKNDSNCPLDKQQASSVSKFNCNDCGCSHTFVYIHVVTVTTVTILETKFLNTVNSQIPVNTPLMNNNKLSGQAIFLPTCPMDK